MAPPEASRPRSPSKAETAAQPKKAAKRLGDIAPRQALRTQLQETPRQAEVAELADAADSKSVVLKRRVGSTPTFGTAENKLDSLPPDESSAPQNRVSGQAIGQDPGQRESPRATLIAALTSAIRDAAAAGDLAAARVAHDALGRLLSEPGAGAIVDLNAERERRR